MVKNSAGLFFAVLAAGCRPAEAKTLGFQGVVEFEEHVISAEVAGRLLQVPVKRGDVVKVGDQLAELDDKAERLQREARTADVTAAQAQVTAVAAPARREDIAALAAQVSAAKASEDLLRKTADRTRQLFKTNAIAEAELERAVDELARASSERASLESKLASLRKGARAEDVAQAEARAKATATTVASIDDRLARYSPKSPVAGTIVDLHAKVGELANVGTPLATVADVTHPYVDVFVPQAKLGGIALGTKAEVRVDAEANAFAGVVEWISPRTEFTPRFLFSDRERANLVTRVRIRVDDPGAKLHSGVPAFAKVP